MTKRFSNFMIIGFITVLALAVGSAYAQSQSHSAQHSAKAEGDGAGSVGGMRMMQSMSMMSQLSPEEQKLIEQIHAKHNKVMQEMWRSVWAKNAEFNGVLAQEKPDMDKARAVGKELTAMYGKMHEAKIEMYIEMREKGVSYYGAGMAGGMMGMKGGMMGGKMKMMGDGMMGPGMMNMMGPGMMMPKEQ